MSIDQGPVAPAVCGPEDGCITCGDVAVPMRVLEVDADRGLALCEDDQGRHETVEIALVEAVDEGQELLVHAATAIARIGENAGIPGREAEEMPGAAVQEVPGL